MKTCPTRTLHLWPLLWALAVAQAVASSHTQEARDWAYRQAQEDQRQRQEQFDREKKSYGTHTTPGSPTGSGATAPSGSSGSALRDQVERLRAHALKLPALPPDRNPLLGSWKRTAPANADALGGGGLGQLMAMAAAGPCGVLFGAGSVEFGANEYFSTDASGRDSLGRVQYRMEGKRLYVIPQGGVRLLLFESLGRDRIREALVGGDCTLARVGAPAASAAPSAAPGAKTTAMGNATAVLDGAAFRCSDGSLLHVSLCQGAAAGAMCQLTELQRPGLQIGTPTPRADIAARVKGCEVGGIRYGGDNKPVFVR